MPSRKYIAGSGYRYGFNGKENDKDAGEGIQDYGMRIYSERLGKFLSVDPITDNYPELTPYQFASNTPIMAIDLDGLEGAKKIIGWLISPMMGTTTDPEIRQGVINRAKKTYTEFKESIKKIKDIPVPTTTLADPRSKIKEEAKRAKAIAEGLKQTWEEYKKLVGDAIGGDKEAVGGVIFEAAMFVIPGFEELAELKVATKVFNGVATKVFSKKVANSVGKLVERQFVKTEDDLLRVAEDAAGGSLDNFVEVKPNFYEGVANGKKLKIEWQPGGEPVMGEGPHVKILEWNSKKGKKGGWETKEKYFLLNEKEQQKIIETIIKKFEKKSNVPG